ncbi:MAG: hypothetical protein HKP06_03425 [Flavobacteriaceae bacterium]|nr:hypothetical protein [Flavobacteriaceae bacterium]
MKLKLLFLFVCISALSCKQEPESAFNMGVEPLSTKAELKTASWIGYKEFSFELQNIAENFSKEFAVERTRNLLSAAQSVLYSMPGELRNETTNDKASEMVEATKALYNAMTQKSEEEIIEGFNKITAAFSGLNTEINYYTEN